MCALAPAACGGGDDGETRPPPRSTVVVYSSLPLHGQQGVEGTALNDGIRLALEQSGGRAGGLRVRLRQLDDADPKTGKLDRQAAADNAREAARDAEAVAYIGELDEGSTNSVPVSNEGGIAQIGTADTAVGLTTREAGASADEPERYYPSAKRSYVRIVPRDTVQGFALVSLTRRDGCARLAVADDGTRFGTGLARALQVAAQAQRLEIALAVTIDPRRASFRSQAGRARSHGADCFLFAGVPSRAAVRAYADFADALPSADLFGPDRLADARFTEPKAGGLSSRVAKRIRLTAPALPPAFPPETQRFASRYERAYDETPTPTALYGYEAMLLVLDAIERSGDGGRAAVIKELFETENRRSVLGSYSIDPNGDTTLANFGVFSIVGGKLEEDGTVRAELAR